MTPRELLAAARHLVDEERPELVAIRPRAAAMLTRQALERIVADALPEELGRIPFSVQLLCYRDRAEDQALAERLAATWSALSEACHFHGYELAPSAASLRSWIALVERAADRR